MNKGDALVEVLKAHGVSVGRTGNVSCPFHQDGTPSMSLDRIKGLYKCHSCGKGGDVFTFVQEMEGVGFEEAQRMLTITPTGSSSVQREVPSRSFSVSDEMPDRLAPVPAGRMEHLESLLRDAEARMEQSDQGQAYVASRGLTEATRRTFRLGIATAEFGMAEGSLVIPYLGAQGLPLSLRTRCIKDHDHIGHGKYMGASGDSTRMFNTSTILDNPTVNELHIAEGETDCMSLHQCGLVAVGFPGVNNVKPHHLMILRGFDTVYIWGDNDKAGHEFRDKLMGAIAQARSVQVPDGDVNATLTARGSEGVLRLIGR